MKIAVSGKGGSGKTTITGTLARIYGQSGRSVLAIDGDPNPNLAVALGITHERSEGIAPLPGNLLVEQIDASGKKRSVLGTPLPDIIARYGAVAPDNVTLLVGCRVDHAGKG
jgi:CO dehydrogenase maturation factor